MSINVNEPREIHKAAEPPPLRAELAWFAVAVLFVVQLFSFLDRQALSLLISPIKSDLGLNDTQVSLVIGLGFALSYAIAGIPIGRLVDRYPRPMILATGLAVWSVCTAGCGFVRSFGQLALFRSGVGIGEATATPVVISLLGDYFKPTKRGLAFGIFAMSVYVGIGLSLVVGGAIIKAFDGLQFVNVPILGAIKPWQVVFLIIGPPGLLVLPLVLMLKEPRGRAARSIISAQNASTSPTLAEVGRHYRTHWVAFATQHFASAMLAMLFYGVSSWVPEFLRRTYGMPIANAGFAFGMVTVAAGAIGVLTGGIVSDHLLKRGKLDARLRTTLCAALLAVPFAALFPVASTPMMSLALVFIMILCTSTISTVGSTGVQELAPPRMRGTASAIYLLVFNGIGLSLGPTIFALLTDHVFGDSQMLWRSLSIAAPCMALGSALLAYLGLAAYRACVLDNRQC